MTIKVTFSRNLTKHIVVNTQQVEEGNLSFVLSQTFRNIPALKPYVLDEQSNLRKHVMLAIDQQLIQGNLSNYLNHSGFSRLHIMQALSGG